MTPELFEQLLYQEEGVTLDFKRENYCFDGGKEVEKAELLKDLLAFANSWRQESAYILLGVQETPETRPHKVVGIAKTNLSRNIQQFIESKTTRPLVFTYTEFDYLGARCAAFEIPVQDRPIALKSDYGHVRANAVYVRRGDATVQARIDEVIKMASAKPTRFTLPQLSLALADLEQRTEYGQIQAIELMRIKHPSIKQLPDYSSSQGFYSVGYENSSFLRDRARYAIDFAEFQPLGFCVRNVSSTCAENVVLRCRWHSDLIAVRAEDDMPEKPAATLLQRGFQQPSSRAGIQVQQFEKFADVSIQFGTVQPGACEWSREPIYVKPSRAGTINLKASLLANNVPAPIDVDLSIECALEERSLTLSELEAIVRT